MRSELVFEAVHTLRNRYTLCQLASKATRKFHKPNTRIQDTTNEVFHRIADSDRQTSFSNRRRLPRRSGAQLKLRPRLRRFPRSSSGPPFCKIPVGEHDNLRT